MRGSGVAMLQLLLLVQGVLSQSGGGGVCHVTQEPVSGMCSSVKMLFGAPSKVHLSVLEELCHKGQQHVLIKGRGGVGGKGASIDPSSPFKEPLRRAEQFVVMNLHRDSFSDKVTWSSGDARDVICEKSWFVDEEVALANSYSWYRHGLPIWPLLNQTLAPKISRFSRQKKLDWPNYAIATPLYIVPYENLNLRDPKIAINKLFTGDTVHQQDKLKLQNEFVQSVNFQKDILEFYEDRNADIIQDAKDYMNWLLPLMNKSLRSMIESFKERQKKRAPKHSEVSFCPDELYVFFLEKPCSSVSSCHLLNHLQLILRTVGCSAITDVVVGFSRQ
ncbi:uncharacterized protein LOC121861430 [Homarus americanus]|uniref:uncharacterized protein LOC121861430 n=1 Tax=Homarus americanus TaxID=6706 RepID=UPI001C466013|nr:uncharacterized protein LOC121861430 [Homarus americanus]